MLFVIPLVLLAAYFGGLMFALRMPEKLAGQYPAEELGEAGAALQLTYASNLVLALFCIIAALVVIVLAMTWCRAAYRRYKRDGARFIVLVFTLTFLTIAVAGGTSWFLVTGEDLFEISSDAQTDKLLNDGGAYERYEGVANIRGSAPLAGASYNNKPDAYYELRLLENGTSWISVYCPIDLAKERGIDSIAKNEPYDEITVRYLPNTYVVTEVWRAGQEPPPEEDEPEEDEI